MHLARMHPGYNQLEMLFPFLTICAPILRIKNSNAAGAVKR